MELALHHHKGEPFAKVDALLRGTFLLAATVLYRLHLALIYSQRLQSAMAHTSHLVEAAGRLCITPLRGVLLGMAYEIVTLHLLLDKETLVAD